MPAAIAARATIRDEPRAECRSRRAQHLGRRGARRLRRAARAISNRRASRSRAWTSTSAMATLFTSGLFASSPADGAPLPHVHSRSPRSRAGGRSSKRAAQQLVKGGGGHAGRENLYARLDASAPPSPAGGHPDRGAGTPYSVTRSALAVARIQCDAPDIPASRRRRLASLCHCRRNPGGWHCRAVAPRPRDRSSQHLPSSARSSRLPVSSLSFRLVERVPARPCRTAVAPRPQFVAVATRERRVVVRWRLSRLRAPRPAGTDDGDQSEPVSSELDREATSVAEGASAADAAGWRLRRRLATPVAAQPSDAGRLG